MFSKWSSLHPLVVRLPSCRYTVLDQSLPTELNLLDYSTTTRLDQPFLLTHCFSLVDLPCNFHPKLNVALSDSASESRKGQR
jgi:hypothetical protein